MLQRATEEKARQPETNQGQPHTARSKATCDSNAIYDIERPSNTESRTLVMHWVVVDQNACMVQQRTRLVGCPHGNVNSILENGVDDKKNPRFDHGG
jgi:hypothetical protein